MVVKVKEPQSPDYIIKDLKVQIKKWKEKCASLALAYALLDHMNEYVNIKDYDSRLYNLMIETRWKPGILMLKKEKRGHLE